MKTSLLSVLILSGLYYLTKGMVQAWPLKWWIKKEPHLISDSDLPSLSLEVRLKKQAVKSLLIADMMIALAGFLWFWQV